MGPLGTLDQNVCPAAEYFLGCGLTSRAGLAKRKQGRAAGNAASHSAIQRPTQDDLALHCEDHYYLDIGSDAYAGQPLAQGAVQAPMYATAQEWDNCMEITSSMSKGRIVRTGGS